MNNKGIHYAFSAKVWRYPSAMSWFFVSLPQEMSNEIRENLKFMEEGWGRLKATARVGRSEWETAIWFDTKHNTYLLPIKTEIRKKESVGIDEDVTVDIWI